MNGKLQRMKLRTGCAQIAPLKANLEFNLDRVAELIQQAMEEEIDLLLFPETSLSGYYLEGGVIENAITQDELTQKLKVRLDQIPHQRRIDFALGFYHQQGGNLYNSAIYYELSPNQLKPLHVYSKLFLPTYGVFDEKRFVSRGNTLGVFDSRFGRVALMICEDVWHSIMPTLLALAGAQIFLIPSASPARGFQSDKPSNLEKYENLLKGISSEHGVFCLNAMLCGFEGGKGLVGGSMVVDPFGSILVQGPVQEEFLLKTEIDLDEITIARAQSPLLADLKSVWSDLKKIINQSE